MSGPRPEQATRRPNERPCVDRLDYVGSDHFPMYLALSYEPAREQEQPKPEEDPDDREQADEMVERT